MMLWSRAKAPLRICAWPGAVRGDGVPVVGVSEIRAAGEEAVEAAGAEVGRKRDEVVGAELVDGDDDGEFWGRGGRGRGGAEGGGEREEDEERPGENHGASHAEAVG